MSCKTMKEAYAVRRTVPPSAEIQANIDKLLGSRLVDDPQKMLSELARLGAGLIIQRAVEEEFDSWLGRARYERRPERQRGLRNGFRPRRLQTAEGELRIEIPQAREAAMPFVSKLFPKWHCKRLLRTDPLKALIIGGFVRGLVRWRTHGNATALRLAAASLRSAIPAPLPKSASDWIVACARFPQRSGTNAETRPMIVAPSFANPS